MRLSLLLASAIFLSLGLTLDGVPSAQAQLVRDHDALGLRSFHGVGSRIRRSFQSDAEAHAIFKQILAASGLAGMEDRIVVRASAETDSAEALIERKGDKEERLIFYNAEFMQEIAAKNKNYWSMVAILAHEVGHHIRLHTIIPGRDHEFELEADYQAGFILRRMGATLDQTQAAFRTLGTDMATTSHPARAQRVQAATLGWVAGSAEQPSQMAGSTTPIPLPQLKSIAVAPPPLALSRGQRFDGTWLVTMVCPAVRGTHGFSRRLVAQVHDGRLRSETGTKGKPYWLVMVGKIEPDGTAWISADGLTGDTAGTLPPIGAAPIKPGTSYSFVVTARFEEAWATGKRTGDRDCDFTFAKQ